MANQLAYQRTVADHTRYVLFSIGNLTPLFQAVWPSCWKTFKTCNKEWIDAVNYLEVIGIIVLVISFSVFLVYSSIKCLKGIYLTSKGMKYF